MDKKGRVEIIEEKIKQKRITCISHPQTFTSTLANIKWELNNPAPPIQTQERKGRQTHTSYHHSQVTVLRDTHTPDTFSM